MNRTTITILTILVISIIQTYIVRIFFPNEDIFSSWSLFLYFSGLITSMIYQTIDERFKR